MNDVDECSHHSVLSLGNEVQARRTGREKKRNNLHAGLLVLQKEKKRNFHLKVKKVMCKPPKHILKYTSKKEVILRLC